MTDRHLIYSAAFLRAVATGMVGVLLGLYLARLGFDPAAIGLVISAGLAGATLGVAAVTFLGDRLGRRRALVGLALLGAASGFAAALAADLALIAAAAFLGMLNGQGRDRGASLVVEQAILPATGTDAEIEGLIAQRLAARRAKDWAEADRIRDELKGKGVLLEDGPGGTTWRRG